MMSMYEGVRKLRSLQPVPMTKVCLKTPLFAVIVNICKLRKSDTVFDTKRNAHPMPPL